MPLLARSKWAVFVFSSALLWGYAALIRSGLKTAGMINVAITALKLVPLVVVAAAAVARFRPALAGDPFASDPGFLGRPGFGLEPAQRRLRRHGIRLHGH